MTAQIIAAKIGGIPIVGGHVPLEQADVGQVLTAASGLVRETVSAGIKLGFVAVGGALLLQSLAAMERAQAARELDRKMNPPLPLGGICLVSAWNKKYHGICLNETISFESTDGQSYTADINHVTSILFTSNMQREESGLFFKEYREYPARFTIELVDGSKFEHVSTKTNLRFATIVGEDEVLRPGKGTDVTGISHRDLLQLRDLLLKNLHAMRPETIKDLGPEIVEKYFHLGA
jgi:hypothetical protein